MTYLEKWFDFNRRQKEIESLLEETVANQSEQRLTLKEFYLLYYLDLADEKSLRQIDLPDKLHLSPSAVSRMVARLEAKNCGLLSRMCCDQDRRSSFICLTSDGQKIRGNHIKLFHDSNCWRQKENGHIGQQEISNHVDMSGP